MPSIVITGGHHNSALVVAKELRAQKVQVKWIGHRHTTKGDLNDSAEYLEVKASGFPFYELKAGKLDFQVRNLLTIPLGLYRSWRYLKQLKPVAVLSFGGYLGLAVSLSARLMGIPVYLHEQTLVAGKANHLTARFARRVYLTWQQSETYFPSAKTKVVGLPLRDSILHAKPKKLFTNNRPTILVLCGKQGSHVINQSIFSALPLLLRTYNVVHQTGMSSLTKDYEKALALRNSLRPAQASAYLPISYIGEAEIGSYLASADLLVGRSGAHTAYELGVLGRKSLLIPYMHTTGREQYKQAKLLEASGYAKILPQSQLSVNTLLAGLAQVERMTLPPTKLPLPLNASRLLVDDLLLDLRPSL